MIRFLVAVTLSLALAACGSDSDDAGGAGSGGTASGGTAGNGGSSASGGSGGSGVGGTAGSSADGGAAGIRYDIGQWNSEVGACPDGIPRVDISTSADLAAAARGEGKFANDAPGTCYLIANGDYEDGDVILYVKRSAMFVGQDQGVVVIHGRGSIEDGVSDVTIRNLTFDLTGYVNSGSFNTLSVGNGKNVTVTHVTFTGDCNTGAKGGHIETNGTDGMLIDSCLIEKFGRCSSQLGHEDHGIYLASGKNITIRNNDIRQNASRGIQMYTQQGEYGTLDHITVERNRIHANGHASYEDGIVINAAGTGTIDTVAIRHNLIYENYYSGIRFVGGAQSNVSIELNTFSKNGGGSEINIDDVGGAAGTLIQNNIFVVNTALLNNCFDASSLGFSIGTNFVNGNVGTGDCISSQIQGDPQFVNGDQGDFHPQNPAAQAFGAYAPDP